MRRSTAFLTAAALAIGGISLPTQVFSQAQNQSGSNNNSNGQGGATGSSSTAGRDSSAESGRHAQDVGGVQQSFARATDAAVSENGLSQLQEMFASRERMQGRESDEGSSARGGVSGGSSSDRSGTSAQTPGSSGRTGSAGATGSERTGSNTAETAGSPRANGTGAQAGSNAQDQQQLNQIVQQIREEWKQKYNQDFKITNESVVFSDITAADIGMREAQPAAGELRGTHSGAAGESRDLSGDQRGTGAAGSSSDRSGTGSANSSSGRSSTYSRNDRTSSSASGSAASEANESAEHAGQHGMAHPITVNVPAVRGTEAVQVRLVREGGQFKFASHGQIDQQKLADALEKHLREVQESQKDWPTDPNQGYRLVTQHVLMAINDATGHMGQSGEGAQPAGSRIRGPSDASGSNSSSTGTGSKSESLNKSGQ